MSPVKPTTLDAGSWPDIPPGIAAGGAGAVVCISERDKPPLPPPSTPSDGVGSELGAEESPLVPSAGLEAEAAAAWWISVRLVRAMGPRVARVARVARGARGARGLRKATERQPERNTAEVREAIVVVSDEREYRRRDRISSKIKDESLERDGVELELEYSYGASRRATSITILSSICVPSMR